MNSALFSSRLQTYTEAHIINTQNNLYEDHTINHPTSDSNAQVEFCNVKSTLNRALLAVRFIQSKQKERRTGSDKTFVRIFRAALVVI